MSRTYLRARGLNRSRASLRSKGSMRTRQFRKKRMEEMAQLYGLKPYGFCCSTTDFDSAMKYNEQKPPFKSSLTAIQSIHDSPTLKLRTSYVIPKSSQSKKKAVKSRRGSTDGERDHRISKFHYPTLALRRQLLWYIEDEVDLAQNMIWHQRQKTYNEEADKAALLGEKKVKERMNKLKDIGKPRWYQDFSITQMQNLMELENAIRADNEEKITTRTQKVLAAIGVTSSSFKLSPCVIRTLQKTSNLQSIGFFREVYKKHTGTYFEEEEYKKEYDCNERIILSAIAFLTLPEAVTELDKRLPPVELPQIPPKPQPVKIMFKKSKVSPYKDSLFLPPDWAAYRTSLEQWRKQCKLTPIPKVILPLMEQNSSEQQKHTEANTKIDTNSAVKREDVNLKGNKQMEKIHGQLELSKRNSDGNKKNTTADIVTDKTNDAFDFMISGIGQDAGHIDYKINGTLRPRSRTKSWLGEKDPYYVISGIHENEEPPNCPINYELTGVVNVTPVNSNTTFFSELKLGNGPKKIYPSGRKNLSKNWQEWLQSVDEEFFKVEAEANRIIKSVEATMKLVMPGPMCDSCCACRQTRKSNIKYHTTKTPFMVIESVAGDDNENKYIVGSIAMHSPAPSPPESTVNLLEVVASEDKITKNLLINGITDENGKTTYYIAGVSQEVEHIPKKIIAEPHTSKISRNVPSCSCAIERIFNKGLKPEASNDDIPWTKKEDVCPGKKFRPVENSAYSCKEAPNDKSCRRSPFKRELKKMIEGENTVKSIYPSEERKMYSLAKFQPCGDDDGMAICRGPWGATNIPDPDEIARREAKAKEILKGPPCGEKPGRAVCGGQWGMRIPIPKKKKSDNAYSETLKLSKAFPQPSKPLKKIKEMRAVKETAKQMKLAEKLAKQDIVGEKENATTQQKIRKETRRFINKRMNNANEKSMVKNQSSQPRQNVINKKKGNSMSRSANREEEKLKVENIVERRGKRGTEINSEHHRERRTSNFKKLQGKKDLKSPINYKNEITEKSKKQYRIRDKSAKESSNKEEKIREIKERFKNMSTLNRNHNIDPVHIPEKPKFCKVESTSVHELFPTNEEKVLPLEKYSKSRLNDKLKQGPFGWKTKSQQGLPTEKTLIFLTEPTYPMEMVPVHPGGKPCKCRESRNNRRILLYNIGGTINQGKSKGQEIAHVVEGVTYITPPPSPRISDEYVPEYDLLDVPDDTCVREVQQEKQFKYTEQYLGPKSLHPRKAKNRPMCKCGFGSSNDKNKINQLKLASDLADLVNDGEGIDTFAKCRGTGPCWQTTSNFEQNKPVMRKLQVKRPVCECKYERKILRREEERTKWTERQKRLKSYKKTPFVHIGGTLRPMEKNTKFIISGVKRIPKENPENGSNVKYIISGVADHYKMAPLRHLISGVTMHTPTVTPEPSKPNIPCVCNHKHWSLSNIPSGPTSTKRSKETEKESDKMLIPQCREKTLQISCGRLAPCERDQNSKLDLQKLFNQSDKYDKQNSKLENIQKCIKETGSSIECSAGVKTQTKIEKDKPRLNENARVESPTAKTGKEMVKDKMNIKDNDLTRRLQNDLRRFHKTTQERQDDEVIKENMHEINEDSDLLTMVKRALCDMANEGFLFAKLHASFRMPQLQYWINYRKGFVISDNDKDLLLRNSVAVWNAMQVTKMSNFSPPSMDMSKNLLKTLTYDRAVELKNKVEEKKAVFLSQVRKSRVSAARGLWDSMEFGKYPSTSFKQAYFTYLPGKAEDGHVFRPWKRSDSNKER
ncbi:uncharacterized protein LOC105700399 [Orussus abietinus]|uniref:uncharacterized protein LOC105700399 n=1 Tax=Orussus abietinus TaxID=222816 RepID=UPI000C715D46|nr:uncharacterized protein LOC105700399 [Orussus abietinus]